MSNIEAQAAGVFPPFEGGIYVASASTTTAFVDLHAAVSDPFTKASIPKYLTDRYLSIQADGGDIYVALTVGTGGSLSPAAAGGNFGATNCIKIPQDQRLDLWIPVSPLRYLGFVTANGTATLRLWASSTKPTV